MLQKLNERIQGVVAWVVIVLITITFLLFGLDYFMQSRHEVSSVVDINDVAISKQDFELNYRRTRQLRDPSQLTSAGETQLKQDLLNEMIINHVSMQSARSNGFEVDEAQTNSAIMSIPQFQQDGHFSTDRYQHALSGALFTPDSFRREVRQGMLLNQQRFTFIGTAFALPTDIQQFVKLYMQTRDYSYVQIPATKFVKQMSITEQEIDDYYKKHQKEFLRPEKVVVDYIQLSMADIRHEIKVSDDQIFHYYEDNKSNYYTPMQWKVAHILFAIPSTSSEQESLQIKETAESTYQSLLKNPAQFESYVKTQSSDKISALNGGELPWIVAGQSEFDKELLNMTKPGQILPPVKSEHGYELFKLMAYKPAVLKPLKDVKAQIAEQLIGDLAQAKYAQALDQLSDLSYQTPDSLGPVAEALKLKVQQSIPFSHLGGDNELTKNTQVVKSAFSHDVLGLGNNSEPIQLDVETVVVLRINKHFPAAEQTLAEVKPLIEQNLILAKAKIAARQLGKQLLADSKNLQKDDQLIKSNQLQLTPINKATRDTEAALPVINEMAFNLPRIGAKVGRSLVNGDYVIVYLNNINDGNVDTLDKEQVASITQQIEANYGKMDYDLYLSNLMSQAKIAKH